MSQDELRAAWIFVVNIAIVLPVSQKTLRSCLIQSHGNRLDVAMHCCNPEAFIAIESSVFFTCFSPVVRRIASIQVNTR